MVKKRGRPVIGDPRTAHLHVRLPHSKVLSYRETAARHNLSVTEWVERTLDSAAARRVPLIGPRA